MTTVKLEVSIEEMDFIINVLGAVPTLNTMQAGRLDLIPKLRDQAQWSLRLQQEEQERELRRRDMEAIGRKDAETPQNIAMRERLVEEKAEETAR